MFLLFIKGFHYYTLVGSGNQCLLFTHFEVHIKLATSLPRPTIQCYFPWPLSYFSERFRNGENTFINAHRIVKGAHYSFLWKQIPSWYHNTVPVLTPHPVVWAASDEFSMLCEKIFILPSFLKGISMGYRLRLNFLILSGCVCVHLNTSVSFLFLFPYIHCTQH